MPVLSWMFGGQPPAARVKGWQVRRLFALGISLRWATAALAAAAGLLAAPQQLGLLVALVIGVAIYNSWLALAIRQADEAGARHLMRVCMLIDQVIAFGAVAVFWSQWRSPAPYLFVTLEAVVNEGVAGGIVSVTLFVILEFGFQVIRQALLGTAFSVPETVVSISVVGLAAAAFIGVLGILTAEPPAESVSTAAVHPNGNEAAVRLTRREREVIQLIASGYSNGMIATELHLSESTVKSYVELLLNHLNVRNRSEAVAAASRLKLL